MIGMVNGCGQQSTELFMKKVRRTMCCRRSLSRFGKKQGVIHLKRVSRSDGWLQSRADVPLTGCAGVRLILARETSNSTRQADEVFMLNDLRHFLKECMRILPRLQREALELAFFKGLSHREIAAATHAPLGTVKTRLELGLQKLTHALRPLRHKV
jgi:RNA polymerase sigma factor (sigma-70 family)